MATKQEEQRYHTLPEVAERLGLGRVRRACRTPAQAPISEEERTARAVRRLIRSGDLLAVLDGGRYLVREDWLVEYEDRRQATAIRRAREARGA